MHQLGLLLGRSLRDDGTNHVDASLRRDRTRCTVNARTSGCFFHVGRAEQPENVSSMLSAHYSWRHTVVKKAGALFVFFPPSSSSSSSRLFFPSMFFDPFEVTVICLSLPGCQAGSFDGRKGGKTNLLPCCVALVT